jgi:hypothetical protein
LLRVSLTAFAKIPPASDNAFSTFYNQKNRVPSVKGTAFLPYMNRWGRAGLPVYAHNQRVGDLKQSIHPNLLPVESEGIFLTFGK